MTNVQEMMRQAARIQRKIEQIQTEMKARTWSATSVGGRVKATVTGESKVATIDVDDEFWKGEEREVTLDAITAAINAAHDVATKEIEVEVAKATGGLKIPGM